VTWHLLAHRSELANPGDFVALPWRGDQVVATNFDDDVVVWDGLCPHRGARIYSDGRGNQAPVCAYHGRRARAKDVNRFSMDWAGELLFFSEDAFRVRDPVDPTGGSLGALRPHSAVRFVMDCHWTVAVENALDNEHVAHVHPETLATLGLSRTMLDRFVEGSSVEYFESMKGAQLDRIGRQFESRLPFDYAHAHLFPYACIATTRGWTYSMQHYLPRADGRTDFISRLFVQASAPARLNHFFSTVAATNERVFREDAAICALVPRGRRGRLGPKDDRIERFREAHAALEFENRSAG